MTVWWDLEDDTLPMALHVQKIRFREVGKVGLVELRWNSVNGRYAEADESPAKHYPD